MIIVAPMLSFLSIFNQSAAESKRLFDGKSNFTIKWSPLQVYKPSRQGVEDEIIVSVPAGEICPGSLLGIMGPSGCGKVYNVRLISTILI
jgi:ABC-type transporter Mla maintaining outer membrane lipid asymmetry ATPase subunit MlaF